MSGQRVLSPSTIQALITAMEQKIGAAETEINAFIDAGLLTSAAITSARRERYVSILEELNTAAKETVAA